MFFSNVFFSPKVVYNKRKSDWAPLMCPQPRRCFALGVTVFLQSFCQQFLQTSFHPVWYSQFIPEAVELYALHSIY